MTILPNKTFLFNTTVLLFILLSFLVFSVSGSVNQEVALSSISEAEQTMTRAYEAVLDAERAGAKVSGLLSQLNDAADMLSQGHMAFEVGDFEEAVRFAELSSEVCWEVLGKAESLEVEARNEYGSRRRWVVAGSATGVIIVSITSLLGYEYFKRRYHARARAFIVASLACGLLAASPTLSLFVSFPSTEESFSEFWLLGSDHKAESYPFNVGVNETNGPIYLGVQNRRGSSEYYMVYVKLRNQTQPLPDGSAGEPSPLPPLYESQFFLSDDEVWEHPVTFVMHYTSSQNDSVVVHYTSINGVRFPVNSSSKWDSERKGFYYQLFFELWLHNTASRSFQYHDRFVGIWLNMTIF